jgi:hypothetical protein
MTSPFMDAYVRLLIKTCHKRGVHAMGGMAAQIPIRHDAAANEAALAKVRGGRGAGGGAPGAVGERGLLAGGMGAGIWGAGILGHPLGPATHSGPGPPGGAPPRRQRRVARSSRRRQAPAWTAIWVRAARPLAPTPRRPASRCPPGARRQAEGGEGGPRRHLGGTPRPGQGGGEGHTPTWSRWGGGAWGVAAGGGGGGGWGPPAEWEAAAVGRDLAGPTSEGDRRLRGWRLRGWRLRGWRLRGWRLRGWRLRGWRLRGWRLRGWRLRGWQLEDEGACGRAWSMRSGQGEAPRVARP